MQSTEIQNIAREASQALARLDAPRLEELVSACHTLQLHREAAPFPAPGETMAGIAAAAPDLAIFARVLEVTRANMRVLEHLQKLRAVTLEYSEKQIRAAGLTEAGDGDD